MSATAILALKIVLTPLLIGLASLAGRRWGPSVSGWLVGIPFTSGPIAFFLALGEGRGFAAAAAAGILAGAASQAAFCLAYAWTATRMSWGPSMLAGAAAFIVVTGLLTRVTPPVEWTFVAMVAVLAIALAALPRTRASELSRVTSGRAVTPPGWDIPARMLVATAFVVVLTAAAPALGPRLAGLIAPFPVYAAVLAAFAHSFAGEGVAEAVLRGLLLGLFSFTVFFLALAELLVAQGIAIAFGVAIGGGLAVQGATLYASRRWSIA